MKYFILLLLLTQTALAVEPDFYDPRSSLHRSGVDVPRDYFLPQTPAYNRLDPAEYKDYYKKGYAPYASLKVFRTVQSNDTVLPAGYYLVKKTPISLIIKQSGEEKLTLPIIQWDVTGQTKKGTTQASWVVNSDNPLNPQALYLKYCDPVGCYKTGPVTPGLVE